MAVLDDPGVVGVVDDEGNGVQGMGRADGGLPLLGLGHLVGVAVVGGDQDGVAVLVGGFHNGRHALVHALHGVNHRVKHTGVANHVAVGEVAAQELELFRRHVLHHLLGDLLGLHGRGLLEGDDVGGNFLVDFQILVHLAGTVAVPEIGHMAVLLGLGQGILVDSGGAQHLGQGMLDDGGLHQIMLGNLQVAVVLEHTGKLHAGVVAPVEVVKLLAVKGQGNLLRPVAPEVEEDDAVAVGDLRHRRAAPLNHESGQILVDAAGLGAVGLDGRLGGGESSALCLDVGAPALLHHRPVGLVAIHGDLHTAAAGGDGVVAALGVQLGKHLLQHVHIFQRGSGRHVTAVQKDMAVGPLHALGVGFPQHGDEVMDVGMDIAVGQQPQEMQRLAGNGVGDQVFPGLGGIQRAVFDGLTDKLRALGVDLTAAQRVVADLGVAHIVVRGQTDGGAVGFQISMGAGGKQAIQRGGLSDGNRVAAAAVTLADTVHDNKNNGFFHKNFLQKRAIHTSLHSIGFYYFTSF